MTEMGDLVASEAGFARAAPARIAVEAARAGNDATWHDLFLANYPPLCRFFRARLPSADEAEDLAAAVFAEAWRSRSRLRWRRRPFAAWLFGIARHRLATYYRNRPPQDTADLADLPDAVSGTTHEHLALELRDILERLSPEHCTALELRYIVGLSGVEAAATMGRSHSAYRALLHRALRAFLQDFQAADAD